VCAFIDNIVREGLKLGLPLDELTSAFVDPIVTITDPQLMLEVVGLKLLCQQSLAVCRSTTAKIEPLQRCHKKLCDSGTTLVNLRDCLLIQSSFPPKAQAWQSLALPCVRFSRCSQRSPRWSPSPESASSRRWYSGQQNADIVAQRISHSGLHSAFAGDARTRFHNEGQHV